MKQYTSSRAWLRGLVWAICGLLAIWLAQANVAATQAAGENWTVPPAPPLLLNPDFECSDGYLPGKNPAGDDTLIPNGWQVIYRDGSPIVSSTRQFYSGECVSSDGGRFIERLHHWDSLLVRSEDIETPPEPGKPFDVVLYQTVDATPGGTYSLSGWMVTLCGNKGEPFDCPSGNYMLKAVAIDPTGGTDPDANHLVWVENRLNFVDGDGERQGWQNLRTSAIALEESITVFARMSSPFQWHGNLGFVDAFSLVRGPLASLDPLPDTMGRDETLALTWTARQSDDVLAVEAGNYDLLIDVQARLLPGGAWQDFANGVAADVEVSATEVTFSPKCADVTYEFRLRARTEQPDGEPGAYPNHRYEGVWGAPESVRVHDMAALPDEEKSEPNVLHQFDDGTNLYLPNLVKRVDCTP